jgi:CHAT domain-containing protein
MKVDLNSDLVLLSACETATDDQASGRAFSGMVNSFFFAGSNSVIASHWKIESSSTVLITTSVFENLINKKNSTAESLRNSILSFRENYKEFNHPAFWGAFSIILNSREI